MDRPVGIDWSPGIGDPTLAGWLTVVAYTGATILCYLAAQADWRNRHIWAGIGIFELLLGINKQLDLQVLFAETARYVAKIDDWYNDRRELQIAFTTAMAILFIVLIAFIHVKARRRSGTVRTGLTGASIQLVFVCLRAASFHHIDAFLGTRFVGVMANVYLENFGIFVVAMGAAWAIHARRRRRG